MKTTMVLPSYWTREAGSEARETDVVYDHPTPLDQEGTLQRALESMDILQDKDFEAVVIAVANAEDIEDSIEDKVRRIISSVPLAVPVHLFSHSQLKRIHEVMRQSDCKSFIELLELRGYSNVRNLCLFLPHLLGSEIAVLIDDDEVFEDPAFMSKAREFIGRTHEGEFVGAVAGYYLQPDGDWRIKRDRKPWMEHWDKVDRMNEAFDRIIGRGPRLKETPFVFGGNMVVHREIFARIPFDASVTRGEDIDFLINMKMFGHTFFLDNTLFIKHLPPPKPHPIWKQLREDIYRFVAERAKLRDQEPAEGMVRVFAHELDPYPGAFLKDDLEDKVARACAILADDYRAEGKEADARESLENVDIARARIIHKENAFRRLLRTKELWEEMMGYVAQEGMRERLRGTLASS